MVSPCLLRHCAKCLAMVLVLGVSPLAQDAEESHRKRLASPRTTQQRDEQKADAHLKANPQDSQALRARGLARLNLGKLSEASTDLSRAAALAPSQAGVWAELAFALLLQGRWPEALEAARAALTLDRENSAANAYAGHLLLRDGHLEPAIEHLKRAVQRIPTNVDVHLDLLEAYRQKRDFPSAFAQLRELRLLLEPTEPRLIYQEGLLQADLGNLSVAIERLRAALQASPRLAGAREQLAAVMVEDGRHAEALEMLSALAQEQPAAFNVAYLRSLALGKLRRFVEAESEARRALELSPGEPDGYLLLGGILAEAGKREEAIRHFRRARELAPENPEAALRLGGMLAATGNLDEGLALLRRAVELTPESASAHQELSVALRLAGKEQEAAEEAARADRLKQAQQETHGLALENKDTKDPAKTPRP